MDERRNTLDDIADDNTIARCRELLGDEAAGLSDEEIDHIWQHAAAVAHVIVEIFMEGRTSGEWTP